VRRIIFKEPTRPIIICGSRDRLFVDWRARRSLRPQKSWMFYSDHSRPHRTYGLLLRRRRRDRETVPLRPVLLPWNEVLGNLDSCRDDVLQSSQERQRGMVCDHAQRQVTVGTMNRPTNSTRTGRPVCPMCPNRQKWSCDFEVSAKLRQSTRSPSRKRPYLRQGR
jgi:hypothetical protein